MPETVLDITNENSIESESKDSKVLAKLEESTTEASAPAPASPKYDINNFQLKRILNNNSVRKSIALLGTFPDISETDAAIVIFEKKAFQESEVSTPLAAVSANEGEEEAEAVLPEKATYFDKQLKVHTEFINNIYGSYQCIPNAELSGIKVTVVYPATDKHIEKYSICQKYLINETPQLYKDITLPHIESSQFSLDWVYNILEHKQETERIVFEDNDPEIGFILLPDLKWDGRNLDTLYLLAIPHKHDIKSLRDLNATHLPLLRNIRKRAAEAIEERYGLADTQLRMYFHYQPSFYHLHVHINPVRNDAPGIWCEKSHILDTVINNLELMADYYERATLPFVLYDGNKLLELYEKQLVVRKVGTKQKSADNGECEKSVEKTEQLKANGEEEEQDGVVCKKIKLTETEKTG